MILKRLAYILIIVIVSHTALFSYTGEKSLEYVLKNYNARAQGMGGALTGFASGVEAIHYNPAGLCEAKYPEIFTVHGDLGFDRRINGIAFSLKRNNLGLGFGWNRFSIDSIPVTFEDTTTQVGTLSNGNLINQVSIVDWANDVTDFFSIALGYSVFDWISIGGNLKYFKRDLYNFHSSGSSMDIGLKINYHPRVKFGINFKNIFGDMEWDINGHKDSIASETDLGFGYKVTKWLLAEMDYIVESGGENRLNMGVEGKIKDTVFVRVGSDDGKATFGTGINLSNWRIDYSYSKDNLGTNHRISARALFFDWEYPFEKTSRVNRKNKINRKKLQKELTDVIKEEDIPKYGDLITDIAHIPVEKMHLIDNVSYIPINILSIFGIKSGINKKAGIINLSKNKIFIMAKIKENNILINGKKWINIKNQVKLVNKKVLFPPEILKAFNIEYKFVK